MACELYPKRAERGGRLGSLKASGTEMSSSTSNMCWQRCRNIGQPRSNCISKARKTPRIWNTKDTITTPSDSCLAVVSVCSHFCTVVTAASSKCAQGESITRWVQVSVFSAIVAAPVHKRVHKSLAAHSGCEAVSPGRSNHFNQSMINKKSAGRLHLAILSFSPEPKGFDLQRRNEVKLPNAPDQQPLLFSSTLPTRRCKNHYFPCRILHILDLVCLEGRSWEKVRIYCQPSSGLHKGCNSSVGVLYLYKLGRLVVLVYWTGVYTLMSGWSEFEFVGYGHFSLAFLFCAYRNESACFQTHVHINKWHVSPTHKALSPSDSALKDTVWGELKRIEKQLSLPSWVYFSCKQIYYSEIRIFLKKDR